MTKLLGFALAVSLWAQPSFEGNWQGTLDTGPIKLRLAIHVTRNAQGEYAATLDSLDQGANGIPAAKTTVTGNSLHLDISRLRATYDGTLSGDGASIDGTLTQGTALPLALKRVEKIEAPVRPQAPQPPFPYKSEDVSYPNQGVTLAGTLTIPQSGGPFPAAILITGSGTHDRDETVFGHKPFLVIADYLSRRGIAVLRLDDRGIGKSTGNKSRSSFDDLAGDVLAGVDYLASRKEINARKIGVIGHSEGASVGPLAASKSQRIAFVVMLAGIGVTGEEVLLKQGELLVRAQGLGDAAVAAQRRAQEPMLAIVKEEKDEQAAAEKMFAALKKIAPQAPDDAIMAQVRAANSRELRAIINFDAGPILRKLKMPVLAMNGSKDLQVPSSQNLPAISAALKEAGNRDFSVNELPGLNHLFQTCKKCTVAEYGELEETFSPDALKMMGDWIRDHTR
jgi:dienelactone hydrolase